MILPNYFSQDVASYQIQGQMTCAKQVSIVLKLMDFKE